MSRVGIISIATRSGENEDFLKAAKRVLDRNFIKNNQKALSGKDQDQFIFTGGLNNDLDEALKALKKSDISRFDKVYFQAHGNDKVVEVKPPSMSLSNLSPDQLAHKFWEQAGLKDSIEQYVQQSMHVKGDKKLNNHVFDLRIRLLSCLTGFSDRQSPAFVERFLNTLKERVTKLVEKTQKANSDKFKDAAFSILLRAKAPKGWSVILRDGKTISYLSSSAKEKKADEALKRIYDKYASKSELYKANNLYVLPPHDQVTSTAFRIEKSPSTDWVNTYEVPYKSTEKKNSPRSLASKARLEEAPKATSPSKSSPSKTKKKVPKANKR